MSIQDKARAEAERRYAKSAYIPLTPDATRNALREAFEEGAVWQAVHGPMPDRKAIRDAIFGGDQYGAPDRVLALLHGEGKNDE